MISKKIFTLILFICFFEALQAVNVTITTSKDTVCTDANVNFKGSVSAGTVTKYQWAIDSVTGVTILGNDTSQNITLNFAKPGTYTVTLYTTFNPAGVDSSKKIITVIQNATALFGTTGMTIGVPQSVTFVNASTNAPNGFVWNFGDNGTSILTNPIHAFANATTYTVTLTAYGNSGCNNTTSLAITITDTVGLIMPNVFTPNGDGINEYYAPNAHGMKTLSCNIYDRWGIKIITLDNANVSYWDGYTTSGVACSEGTYFYTLTATDVNGKSYNLKGFFQLIK